MPADLSIIVKRSAELLDIEIDDNSCLEIARSSRGTPRLCNRLLKRVRDYAQVLGEGFINKEITLSSLAKIGIDKEGLDVMDRKYLATIIELYKGGPAGIEAIAASLGEDKVNLEDVIEPYLLNKGFIVRTQRGRIAKEKAYRHLNLPFKEKEKDRVY